jgi:hypothetical protein
VGNPFNPGESKMKSPLFVLLLLALAVPAVAQVQGGNLYGTVQDEQGLVLQGASVTLAGSDRTLSFTTGADGRFRFLNVPPGSYKVVVTLPGFATVRHENVAIAVGQNVDLPFMMKVASVEQAVTVTAESPIVDTKATGTSTNFTQAELASVPTSRDPWALLRTVPGVMVDRVNIAGNETGQQSNIQAKGTRPADAVWTMDGVVITDMAAIGASPTYFNYDNFEEIQVSTAGQDIRQSTGGVGLNFVVKRGTNQFKGGFRGYFTNDSLESGNVPDELTAIGVTPATSDHNNQISDAGVELGGPILRDRAWAYGSYSDQDIRLVRRSGGLIDRTRLKTWNIKGTWQATSKDTINVLWFLGAKEKFGRSPGDAGILFDDQTATWDQGGAYTPNRPHGLLKIEDNRVIRSNLFVSGRYAYYGTGFGLVPKGGLDAQAGRSQRLGQSFGSTRQSLNIRPQHFVSGDATAFMNAAGASHEIKFGSGWRRADAFNGTLYPGNMILALDNSATDQVARVYREGAGTNRTQYVNVYVGDRISFNRFTVDAGVRYDRQWGSALPSRTQANKAFPSLVPGIEFGGYRAPFTWNNVSPRVGLTYALDESRRTIVRASFNRYAGQLDTSIVGWSNPSGNVGYAEYGWLDRNGDHFAQADEVLLDQFIAAEGGFNPADPTSVVSANVIDPNLEAPVTTSAVAGFDRELVRNLAVQVSYSFTRTENFAGDGTFNPFIGMGAGDFLPGLVVSGVLPDGAPYNVQTYVPDPDKVAAAGSGRLLTNWPGYRSQYHGVEVSVVKRMADRWMMRVGAAYNNAREHYDAARPLNFLGNPTRTDTEPLVDGGAFVVRSAGSGSGDIFIHGKWQFNAAGMYMLPYDIVLGANVFGRQGYPFPIYRSVALGRDGTRRVLVSPELDTFRLDNLWNVDMRVSRDFKFRRVNIEAIADVFNLLNANTELVRNRNAGATTFEQLAQNLSPRIVRFGLRVGF